MRRESEVGHPLEDVDAAVIERFAHLPPGAETDFDVHPHHGSDGPGELDVVAGRLAVLVEKFVGRIALVATDDNDPAGLRQALLRGGRRNARQKPGGGTEEAEKEAEEPTPAPRRRPCG